MDINYLKEFTILAEIQNFADAAEVLYISQSTLSKHIKKLEEELKVVLFDRSTRRVALSKYGEEFLKYSREIVKLEEEWNERLSRMLVLEKETLVIGTLPSMLEYSVTDMIANFKKNNNKINVKMLQGSSGDLEDMLKRDICEIAFIKRVKDENDELEKKLYIKDHLVLVVSKKHKFAKHKKISLAQLKDEDFLFLQVGSRPYRQCVEACRESGFEPNITYTDSHVRNIIDLVTKNMGVSLLSKKLIDNIASPDLAVLELSDKELTSDVTLCYRKNKQLSKGAKKFLGFFGNFLKK